MLKRESRDALLIGIAKARKWFDDIRLGRLASFDAIAEREVTLRTAHPFVGTARLSVGLKKNAMECLSAIGRETKNIGLILSVQWLQLRPLLRAPCADFEAAPAKTALFPPGSPEPV